jgi:hypothetical protein
MHDRCGMAIVNQSMGRHARLVVELGFKASKLLSTSGAQSLGTHSLKAFYGSRRCKVQQHTLPLTNRSGWVSLSCFGYHPDNPDYMAIMFAHEAQSSLTHTLFPMKTRRARSLGLTKGI